MNTYCQQIMQDSYIIFFEDFAIQYKSFCSYGNLDAIWNVHSIRHKGLNPGLVSLLEWKNIMQWDYSKAKGPTSEIKSTHSIFGTFFTAALGLEQERGSMHQGWPFFVPQMKNQCCLGHVEVTRVSWKVTLCSQVSPDLLHITICGLCSFVAHQKCKTTEWLALSSGESPGADYGIACPAPFHTSQVFN